jgi:predicted transport protein
MEKAGQTMLDNLHKNTGKPLDAWIAIVKSKNFDKHGQIMKFLKDEMGLTHGFANMVALKTLATDAGSVENKDDLVEKQYQGKEHFRPIYDHLIAEIKKFGADVEIAPKNANVSLRRKKQFALLHPITKTRFEIGINLKGHEPERKLLASGNAMCSHKINLTGLEDIDGEVMDWLKKAYQHAG